MKKLLQLVPILAIIFTWNITLSASYSQELQNAYNFAYQNKITTQDSIDKADMNWGLTRIAMAKMLSQYAINILWKTPDTSKIPNFWDVDSKLDGDYNNWVTLAYQLWIMWVWIDKFRPFDSVTRAEFWTALSRVLYWNKYEWGTQYYTNHLNALKSAGIMNQINQPNQWEIRWYVMLMLMRSKKDKNKIDCNDSEIKEICLENSDLCPASCKNKEKDIEEEWYLYPSIDYSEIVCTKAGYLPAIFYSDGKIIKRDCYPKGTKISDMESPSVPPMKPDDNQCSYKFKWWKWSSGYEKWEIVATFDCVSHGNLDKKIIWISSKKYVNDDNRWLHIRWDQIFINLKEAGYSAILELEFNLLGTVWYDKIKNIHFYRCDSSYYEYERQKDGRQDWLYVMCGNDSHKYYENDKIVDWKITIKNLSFDKSPWFLWWEVRFNDEENLWKTIWLELDSVKAWYGKQWGTRTFNTQKPDEYINYNEIKNSWYKAYLYDINSSSTQNNTKKDNSTKESTPNTSWNLSINYLSEDQEYDYSKDLKNNPNYFASNKYFNLWEILVYSSKREIKLEWVTISTDSDIDLLKYIDNIRINRKKSDNSLRNIKNNKIIINYPWNDDSKISITLNFKPEFYEWAKEIHFFIEDEKSLQYNESDDDNISKISLDWPIIKIYSSDDINSYNEDNLSNNNLSSEDTSNSDNNPDNDSPTDNSISSSSSNECVDIEVDNWNSYCFSIAKLWGTKFGMSINNAEELGRCSVSRIDSNGSTNFPDCEWTFTLLPASWIAKLKLLITYENRQYYKIVSYDLDNWTFVNN